MAASEMAYGEGHPSTHDTVTDPNTGVEKGREHDTQQVRAEMSELALRTGENGSFAAPEAEKPTSDYNPES